MLLVLALLWLAAPAHAATRVAKTTYSSDVTWAAAGSPYVLDGDVTVAAGKTLTVEPGVVVKFNGQLRSLTVQGSLAARGSAGRRVIFTSLQDDSVAGDSGGDNVTTGEKGQWRRIYATAGASVDLRYSTIRYGGYDCCGSSQQYGVLTAYGARVTAEQTLWIDNTHSAVLAAKSTVVPTVVISDSVMQRNGAGVSVLDGAAEVHNSRLRDSTSRDGLSVSLGGTYTGDPSLLYDSDVVGSARYGAFLWVENAVGSGSWPRGSRNNIAGNVGNFEPNQLWSLRTRTDADWTDNFWGPNVKEITQDPSCGERLVFGSNPSKGPSPVSGEGYLVGSVGCWRNRVDAISYKTAPVEHVGGPDESTDPDWGEEWAGVPLGQTFGRCGGGTMGVNPTLCQSDPVNAATGSFVHEQADLGLPGRGVPFVLQRSYNSLDTREGRLGRGWRHNWEVELEIASDGSGDATLITEDGQQLRYDKRIDGTYAGDVGVRAQLTKTADGYLLVGKDDLRYRFDTAGRLVSKHDANGQGVTLTHDGAGRLTGATDPAGRTVTFSYDADGKLIEVALPDARKVTYEYTGVRLAAVVDLRQKRSIYAYDADGRLESLKDARGNFVFRNTYSATTGRVVEQLDALGNTTRFSWDAATGTSTVTDARGKAWVDVYDKNRLMERRDPLGNTTKWTYDSDLNVTAVTDPRGHETTMTYDERANMLSRTAPSPLSYTERFGYDSDENLIKTTNGRGRDTLFGYDERGNLTSTTNAANQTTTFAVDARGLVQSITEPGGRLTDLDYDPTSGALASITDPRGKVTTMSYDPSGRLRSRVDPRGSEPGADPLDYDTRYGYDDADQITSVEDPLGHRVEMTYDDVGNLETRTNELGRVTRYRYRADNLVDLITAPDLSTTALGYDAVGNLTRRTDANNHATTFTYDDAGRQTSLTTPSGATWTFGHDRAGNVTQQIDANANANAGGGITRYDYDQLGRLSAIDYGDSTPDVAYAYDANDNRTAMTDGAGTQTYGYDALDRLSEVLRGTERFAYDYDSAGNVTARSYPDGATIDYDHDQAGNLIGVERAGAGTAYAYDAANQLATTTYPSANGHVQTRDYDRAGRLTGIRSERAGSVLADLRYTLDAAGNPTTIQDPYGTTTLDYDTRDRLTAICYQAACPDAGDPFIRYAYDAVGNRLREERPTGTTTDTYDDDDRLQTRTRAGSTTAHVWDANGNLKADGQRSYSYDLADRTTSDDNAPGLVAGYSYDGDGNRIAQTSSLTGQTTRWRWDINNPLALLADERDQDGTVQRSYLHGVDTISTATPDGTTYLHHDAIGSVIATTASGGQPLYRYQYEPYGRPRHADALATGATGSPLRFTGQRLDATGQYHLRARQYDPDLGIFTSRDPLPPQAGGAQGSTYAYAETQPTVLTDPSGMGTAWGTDDACYGSCRAQRIWDFLVGDPLHNPDDAAGLIPAGKILKVGKLLKAAKAGSGLSEEAASYMARRRFPYPATADDELGGVYRQLFRAEDTRPGGTAGALLRDGSHVQKARERANQIDKILRRRTDLSDYDRNMAVRVRDELRDALRATGN